MKKTQFIELFKSIRGDKVSFVSICLFVAFGIALFCGITWTSGSIANSIESIYQEGSARYFEIDIPYSFSDQDIKDVEKIEGVDYIEPIHCAYNFFNLNKNKYQSKILTLSKNLNTQIRVEGNLPEKEGEICVEAKWAKDHELDIGDKIIFEHDDNGDARFIKNVLATDENNIDVDNFDLKEYSKSGLSYLNTDTFTITALAENPAYLTNVADNFGINPDNSIPVDCVMYVSDNNFDNDAFTGYNQLLISSDILSNIPIFGSDYANKENEIKSKIEDLVINKNKDKYDKIIDKCHSIQNSLQSKLNESQNDLINARKDLSDSKINLDASLKQIQDSELQLNSMKSSIPQQMYEIKLQEINQAKQKYNEGKKSIIDAEKEIKNNDDKYSEALSEFQDFKDDTGDISRYDAVVLGRTDLDGYITYFVDNEILTNIRLSLVLLFIIIGMLVCYITITRIVHKRVGVIGIKKAKGIPTSSIIMYYVCYCLLIIVIGALFGGLFCSIPIEMIISYTIADYYLVFNYNIFIDALDWMLITSFELFIVLSIGILSVIKISKFKPILLLTGNYQFEKKQRKPILKLKTFSTFNKVIFRNIFSEKKRCIGTIIGISGCALLLITAFTFRFNTTNSYNYHMDEYFHFNYTITYDDSVGNSYENISNILDNNNIRYTNICYDNVYLHQNGESFLAKIYVSNNSNDFNNIISLKDKDGNDIDLSSNPAISIGYYQNYSLSEDSVLEGTGVRGFNIYIPNTQAATSYLMDVFIFMTPQQYKDITGHPAKFNRLLVDSNPEKMQELSSELKSDQGFINSVDYTVNAKSGFKLVNNITLIMTLVYLCLSILNAIFMLLTLFKLSIDEKKENIIILRINGYTKKHAYFYVFLDIIILAFVAFIISSIIGVLIGNYSVISLYTLLTYFRVEINILAIIISLAITSFLVILMIILTIPEINKLKISDINSGAK